MRWSPELMQLLIGMSMSRYLPATGTAGLLRRAVNGYSRVPRPPPRMRLRTFCMAVASRDQVRRRGGAVVPAARDCRRHAITSGGDVPPSISVHQPKGD